MQLSKQAAWHRSALNTTLGIGWQGCVVAIVCVSCTVSHDKTETADRTEILRLYHATAHAHLAHDAAGFVAANADTMLVIANGDIRPRSRQAALQGVEEYLRGRTISEVTELEPLRIVVSTDGQFASSIGHVRIRGSDRLPNGSLKPFEFTAAWMDMWQKEKGGWHIVAHANTEADSA